MINTDIKEYIKTTMYLSKTVCTAAVQ